MTSGLVAEWKRLSKRHIFHVGQGVRDRLNEKDKQPTA
jgi:hypothetical protein